MTYYYILFSFIGALTLIKAHLVAKNYAPYIASYIINEKMWNPNSDRIKLAFVIPFFIAPFIIFKQLIKYNSNNFIFNCTCLSLIIIIMIFCIWMMKKIIATEFDLKINQTKSLESYFNNNIEFDKINRELKDNKILSGNFQWKYNRKSHKKKYIPILICKLISLDLIKFKEYKEIHNLFEKQLNIKFDYNKTTQIIKLHTSESLFEDEDSEKYFNKLNFLDINHNK